MSAELIGRDLAMRHDELWAQYRAGVMAACYALWLIRREKTYTAIGCKSFGEFLKREGISAASGRLRANVGPALRSLERGGDAALVRDPELLKPIHLMIAKAARENDDEAAERIAGKQANIVRIAARVAHKQQQPLTARILEEVAEKNFHWTPDRKRKKKKGTDVPATEQLERANVRVLLDNAPRYLGALNPENAVLTHRVHELPNFFEVADWFIEAAALARRE